MTSTKGFAAQSAKGDLGPYAFERRELRSDDVGFRIDFTGICHTDIHQVREEWGASIFPMVEFDSFDFRLLQLHSLSFSALRYSTIIAPT